MTTLHEWWSGLGWKGQSWLINGETCGLGRGRFKQDRSPWVSSLEPLSSCVTGSDISKEPSTNRYALGQLLGWLSCHSSSANNWSRVTIESALTACGKQRWENGLTWHSVLAVRWLREQASWVAACPQGDLGKWHFPSQPRFPLSFFLSFSLPFFPFFLPPSHRPSNECQVHTSYCDGKQKAKPSFLRTQMVGNLGAQSREWALCLMWGNGVGEDAWAEAWHLVGVTRWARGQGQDLWAGRQGSEQGRQGEAEQLIPEGTECLAKNLFFFFFSKNLWLALAFWDGPTLSVKCVSPKAVLAFWDGLHSVYGMCISLNKSHFLPITLSLTEFFLRWDIKNLSFIKSWDQVCDLN